MKYMHTYILAFLLCLCSYTLAQENDAPRGVESSAVEKTPKHIKWLESKSDGDQSDVVGQHPLAPSKRVGGDKEQMLSVEAAIASIPLWKKLERLNLAERENASLQFEFSQNLPMKGHSEAANIETLWNRGDYAQAIESLRIWEESNGKTDIAIGISWKVPKPIQSSQLASDVQIGTRQNLQRGYIDFDAVSGNLFAALKQSNDWTVNISTDKGLTWQESYSFTATFPINDIAAAVHSGFFYVLYVGDASQFETRSRRFFLNDGSSDATYSFKIIFNKGVVVNDLAVAATEDFGGQRLYALAILADNTVIYHFATQTGDPWNELATGITAADHGLDAHTNQGSATYFLVISYVSTDDRLHVARRGAAQWLDTDLAGATTNDDDETSVAAYQDRMLVAFDTGSGISYYVSYNGGGTWASGTIASGAGFRRPHVVGRRNGGFTVFYQEEVGEPDRLWYRHRDYGTEPGTAPFDNPIQFNELDVTTGTEVNAEWIPPLAGGAFANGIIWVGGVANNGIFDRIEGALPQLFQGPASGNIAGGALVNTNNFAAFAQRPEGLDQDIPLRNLERLLRPDAENPIAPTGPVGSNFIEDLGATNPEPPNAPTLLANFAGIPYTGSIPPDPHTAVGPNHIMGTVNRQFAIYDKTGALLKLINANAWHASVLPSASPCDPQIVYDHHSNRWIMIWIQCGSGAPNSLLLSVSDDNDPLGDWCTWRLPGDVNGSTVNGLFNDYPKLGVDQNAVYVTANMFFGSNFEYVQLRIIPKAQLLGASCGPVTWTDFWDLRNPSDLTEPVFTTVPAVTFGTPGKEYFVDVDFINTTGTFMNLWSLTNPGSPTPTLTAATVPVVAFNNPTNADQLEGSTTLIDVGGRRNRNAVYQNGSVWTAHSVGDPTGQFARARYVRIDVASGTATEDAAIGATDFWYYYPAVQPDGNGNLVMAFTRSGTSEYPSARYTGRRVSDPPGLQASAELKAGEDNYVRVDNNGRNRWGDYMGIARDPANPNNVCMFVEYAETAVGPNPTGDRWGTWFGCVSFQPAPPLDVRARIECPGNVPQGSQFQAPIFVDMRNVPAPDDKLGSFTGKLTWNPALLTFDSHSGLLSGFTGVVNTSNVGTGTLEFNGANPAGAAGDVNVINITFNVVGANGASGILDLDFSAMAAAGSFTNLLPGLTINDCPYTIAPAGVCGDINDDQVVNSTDCLILLSFDVGIPIPPAFLAKINQGCGDLNQDGVTNSTDALICLTCDAGLPQCPPRVGQPGCCN